MVEENRRGGRILPLPRKDRVKKVIIDGKQPATAVLNNELDTKVCIATGKNAQGEGTQVNLGVDRDSHPKRLFHYSSLRLEILVGVSLVASSKSPPPLRIFSTFTPPPLF